MSYRIAQIILAGIFFGMVSVGIGHYALQAASFWQAFGIGDIAVGSLFGFISGMVWLDDRAERAHRRKI